ncbi:hypothetical protein C8R45DRAFT_967495 [Mycena sanguinolenta]|nr:hypothetical protein C8R45DRAFT_967495 [Mycena sanguinolenta]
MIIAWGFAIGQMVHQVVVTANLLGLYHSAETTPTVSEQQRLQVSFQHLSEVKMQRDTILAFANNFFTDALFIYRCYMVWGEACYRGRVICFSLILVLSITTFEIAAASMSWNSRAYNISEGLGMIMANLFLTGLTAGRIWWTKHRAILVGGTQLVHRCNTAIALLLESSALYFAFMLAFFIIGMSTSPTLFESPGVSVLRGMSTQIMNIIPALLVVRVCLARSVDVDPTAGDLKPHFTVTAKNTFACPA